MKVKK